MSKIDLSLKIHRTMFAMECCPFSSVRGRLVLLALLYVGCAAADPHKAQILDNSTCIKTVRDRSWPQYDIHVTTLAYVFDDGFACASVLTETATKIHQDQSKHKPLIPMSRSDEAMLMAAAFVLLVAAGGGIGGGAVLVPLFIIVGGTQPTLTAEAMSLTSIADLHVHVRCRQMLLLASWLGAMLLRMRGQVPTATRHSTPIACHT
jgi:hypothetical protein